MINRNLSTIPSYFTISAALNENFPNFKPDIFIPIHIAADVCAHKAPLLQRRLFFNEALTVNSSLFVVPAGFQTHSNLTGKPSAEQTSVCPKTPDPNKQEKVYGGLGKAVKR